MNIRGKLKEQRDFILNDPTGAGKTRADDIAKAGKKAIMAGMRKDDGTVTTEWEDLMKFFKNDQRELDRLCGREKEFNRSRWGLMCLAYIAGNSLCTVTTTETTGTERNFSDVMKYNLDAEINPVAPTEDLANYKTALFEES